MLLTMLIGKDWSVQPITTDWKPQVMLASACMLLAMPVLTAIALAASTRFGQVMTIVVCAAVFLLGLLSNYLLGRHAYANHPEAEIVEAVVVEDTDGDFTDAGDRWRLTLNRPPTTPLNIGDRLYYGPSPNGLSMVNPDMDPFDADPTRQTDLDDVDAPRAIVVRSDAESVNDIYEIVNSGSIAVRRPPRSGDFVFTGPTETNLAAMIAWGIAPNLQFFWLVDAVTQAHPIPPKYVGLVALYMLAQVTGLLALAVILFQKRDVG